MDSGSLLIDSPHPFARIGRLAGPGMPANRRARAALSWIAFARRLRNCRHAREAMMRKHTILFPAANRSETDRPCSLTPSRQEVLAQLESIARSGVFYVKHVDEDTQQLKILRHVIEERLAGRTPTQRSILEWLGLEPPLVHKTHGFKDDPTVRVHMRLIRQKLSRYYNRVKLGPSAVMISIPVGQYSPEFAYAKMDDSWTAIDITDLGAAQAACDRQTVSDCAAALQHVNKVLVRHKDHAPALALKADIHVIRAIQGMPPRPELDEALDAARRALAASPDLWQAHNAYGSVQSSLRNWREARKAFTSARKCTPPDVPAHFSYVAFLVARGNLEDATQLVERSSTIAKGYYGHPTLASPVIRADLGFLQLLADDIEAAKATLESTIRDSPPGFRMPYLYLALTHEAADDPRRAVAIMNGIPFAPEPGVELGVRGLLYGLADHQERAREDLESLLAASSAGHYVPAFQLACVYLGLCDHQEALRQLRRAAEDYDPLFHWVPYLPFLRHLAHLPGFHVLLAELGLKWRWRRAAAARTTRSSVQVT